MVAADEEVWQLAALLVRKFGAEDVLDEAHRRAEQASDADDLIGHGMWISVAWAVQELVRPASDSDQVN